jgi:hypothetical protein
MAFSTSQIKFTIQPSVMENNPMMRFLRRLLCALFIAGIASPVMAQGVIPVALSQQMNINGTPLAGALLYTYVVGTVSTPQSTFQDSGLSITNPWPLQADQSGRIPMFYMANGSTHVRLTDSTGLVQFDYANMLVIGASSGGGGGGSVDPTTVLSSGDLKVKYGTGLLSGFVRANGLTIGSAVSGATERANADTQNLFIYLYGADPNLVVSGGRTGNALNDFNSNKTITLPDWRGRALAALDDMGNVAAGRLTATYFGTSATVLGASGGSQSQTLITGNLPPYTPNGSVSTSISGGSGVIISGSNVAVGGTASGGSLTTLSASSTFTGTAAIGQNSTPFSIIQPMMLATVYLKL